MSDGLTFAELAPVPFGVLCGLVHEFGEPAWNDRHDDQWARHQAVLLQTDQALRAAARGAVPVAEQPAPPRRLAAAVRQRVTDMTTFGISTGGFAELRLWERLGLVSLPVDDAHVLAMIGSLGDRWGTVDKAALLRDDPELRDRLWRFFEVEGGGEVSLANVDAYSRERATWRATFHELVDDGTLDRERVLAACLAALQRDFSAYRRSGSRRSTAACARQRRRPAGTRARTGRCSGPGSARPCRSPPVSCAW